LKWLDGTLTEEHDRTNVSIPTALFRKIQEMIKDTHFDSVPAYVAHVLSEAVAEVEMAQNRGSLSAGDEEAVKERLRALGYLG
jgi:hypothetical protein